MKRRDFLKGVGTLAAAEAASSLFLKQALADELFVSRAGLSILQGLTTETTTQLTVDVPKSLSAEFRLTDRSTGKVFEPSWVKQAVNAKSSFRVDKILFGQLELGHSYKLTVKDKKKNSLLDERYLTTVDLQKQNAKIGVASCMKDSSSAIAAVWPSAEAVGADYFFFVGDTVYGDTTFSHGPDTLFARFIESRAKIPFYRWKNLKPVLATWDDHDYGKNNENGSYKQKAETLKVFKSFFGQEPVAGALSDGPGNAFYFKGFNQNFLVLDSRYFRALSDGGQTGFLGSQQIAWASNTMKNPSGPTWIMEGSPFFGRAEKSNTSYQSTAPGELERFLGEVSRWNTRAVLFGGDLHLSETSKLDKKILGYESFEFISSCMHSGLKSKYYSNPNPQMQGTLKENFMLFEKMGAKEDPSWKLSCIGAGKKVLFNGVYSAG